MPPPSLKFPWHHTKAVASARFSGTPPGGASRNRLLTFRTTVTLAVMALITSLALCLILVQYLALRAATQEAASAYMDATTTTTVDALRAELVEIGGIVRVLATNPFLADSDDRSEIGGAVDLFKVA
jgi:adenylate cyclase